MESLWGYLRQMPYGLMASGLAECRRGAWEKAGGFTQEASRLSGDVDMILRSLEKEAGRIIDGYLGVGVSGSTEGADGGHGVGQSVAGPPDRRPAGQVTVVSPPVLPPTRPEVTRSESIQTTRGQEGEPLPKKVHVEGAPAGPTSGSGVDSGPDPPGARADRGRPAKGEAAQAAGGPRLPPIRRSEEGAGAAGSGPPTQSSTPVASPRTLSARTTAKAAAVEAASKLSAAEASPKPSSARATAQVVAAAAAAAVVAEEAKPKATSAVSASGSSSTSSQGGTLAVEGLFS